MSVDLTDRPATPSSSPDTKPPRLRLDPVLDAAPVTRAIPVSAPTSDVDQLRRRARRRQWLARTMFATPVLAAAVLATPMQDSQVHGLSQTGTATLSAPHATTWHSQADVRASRSPLSCSALRLLLPIGTGGCLASPSFSTQPPA